MGKLVFGVGVNDADYNVNPTINDKQVMCIFYQTWKDMLKRCYSKKYQAKHPTYIGCVLDAQWLSFMSFKSWMQGQDWDGKQLDKDLLVLGNKLYSPETCVFVSKITNTFTVDCGASRGEWPIGVHFDKSRGKLKVRCCNPFSKKAEHIGFFTCKNKAYAAWKNRKHELACQLADLQTDERVAEALRSRYL